MDDSPDSSRRSQPGSRGFDPRPYLRQIDVSGRQTEYLDVKWRLVWLRTEHPDARITTQDVTLNDELAVFRATVEIPGGGSATGYGSERREDFAEYIEMAETKAIGRALAALGYGTQFVPDFDLASSDEEQPEPLADAPVERRLEAVETSQPIELPDRSTADDERPANVYNLSRPERPAMREEPPAGTREPFDPANYNWTDFWKWARPLGYRDREHVASVLDRDIGDLTPHEVRRLLMQHRRDQGPE